MTTAVDILTSDTSSSVPVPSQQGSNGSSLGLNIGGDESSSVSSVDDYLLDNDTSSSSYTQEELARLIMEDDFNEELLKDLNEELLKDFNEELLKDISILHSVPAFARIHHEIYQSNSNDKQTNSTSIVDNDKWIEGTIQSIQMANEKITTNELTNNNQSMTTKNNKATSNGEKF